MDGAAGAQYPSLDTPLFSTLAFCTNHPPQKKPQPRISSALLNLIKCMSTRLRFIVSVRIFRSEERTFSSVLAEPSKKKISLANPNRVDKQKAKIKVTFPILTAAQFSSRNCTLGVWGFTGAMAAFGQSHVLGCLRRNRRAGTLSDGPSIIFSVLLHLSWIPAG